MLYIGIDPGNQGAIAVLNPETREVKFFDTPILEVKSGKKTKKEINAVTASLILSELSKAEKVLAVIEKVAPMPSFRGKEEGEEPAAMGVTSAFNFGKGYGIWIGICAALMIPTELVHPVTWKRMLMADMGKEKDASRQKVSQLYPHAMKDLQRKKDHNRADALLLAEWARRSIRLEVIQKEVPLIPQSQPALF